MPRPFSPHCHCEPREAIWLVSIRRRGVACRALSIPVIGFQFDVGEGFIPPSGPKSEAGGSGGGMGVCVQFLFYAEPLGAVGFVGDTASTASISGFGTSWSPLLWSFSTTFSGLSLADLPIPSNASRLGCATNK